MKDTGLIYRLSQVRPLLTGKVDTYLKCFRMVAILPIKTTAAYQNISGFLNPFLISCGQNDFSLSFVYRYYHLPHI